jgi:hypothetical protein
LGRLPGKILPVQVFALTSTRVAGETLDLFLSQEVAEAELREILEGEPGWVDVLRVESIRLDTQEFGSPVKPGPFSRGQLAG